MESLDINKPKKFQFDVSIGGIDNTELEGQFQMNYNNVIIAVPVDIHKSKIIADVPPLQSIIKEHIPLGSKINCNLIIFGEGYYWNPWSESFEAASSLIAERTDVQVKRKKELLDEDKALFDQFNIPDSDSKASGGYEDISSKEKPPTNIQPDGEQAVPSSNLDMKTYHKVGLDDVRKTGKITIDDKKVIIAQEIKAVQNKIPLSETSKHDNLQQLRFRTRVREKLNEAIEKAKLKNKQKKETNFVKNVEQINEETSSSHSNQIINDYPEISHPKDDITEQDVLDLLTSHGMTRPSSQMRMIESARGGNENAPWESVYNTIKNMLKPNQDMEPYSQQMNFLANRTNKNKIGVIPTLNE